MRERVHHSLRPRTWLRFVAALLFALNLPLSMSLASMAAPDRGASVVPAMSCHEPVAPASHDGGTPDPAAALQHLCCFTACIPLSIAAEAALALALPAGEPLLSLLPMRLTPRAVGVDPPPPKA